MLHEEPICLFISRKFQCEVSVSQPFPKNAPELHRVSATEMWNLKELVNIPNILYHAVFTTLLICCQSYKGDWSHSAQLVAMACDCSHFLIPVFPRQPVEHQGWPRASRFSTAIMKTLAFRELLAQWAKRWKKFMQSLIEQWKQNKYLSTDSWGGQLPSFRNAAITLPCKDFSRVQMAPCMFGHFVTGRKDTNREETCFHMVKGG